MSSNKVIVTRSKLTAIANKIRSKLSTQNTYTLDQMPDAIESIGGGGTQATSINIVTELPSTLVEGAVYLIANGKKYVPDFPVVTGCDFINLCGNSYTLQSQNWMDYTRLEQCTKFWLFLDDVGCRCRRDMTTRLSWGNSTGDAMPEHIYEYDTTHPELGWVELDKTDQTVIDRFNANISTNPNAIVHTTLELCYTSFSVYRYTVGNLEFDMHLSILDGNGKLKDIYHIDEYLVYYVENGVATSQGSHTLKWVATNYS